MNRRHEYLQCMAESEFIKKIKYKKMGKNTFPRNRTTIYLYKFSLLTKKHEERERKHNNAFVEHASKQ